VESSKLLSRFHSFKDLKPSQYVERLDGLPELAVYAVYLAAPEGPPKKALENYMAKWRYIRPKSNGHDLKRLGITPGPKYRSILWELRNAWLDGKIQSEEEEIRFLDRLLGRS
jgi:tRNA nucleotidyltransferase (CCA-adding enzyme)